MCSSTTFHVVRFAADKGDEPQVMLITDAEHDRWCECEPPQGYGCFETLHTFDLDHCSNEALAMLLDRHGPVTEETHAALRREWPSYQAIDRDHPYGFCPRCHVEGVTRETRHGGNDRCARGCVYPSADAVYKVKEG